MTLREKITADIKEAMKAKDAVTLGTLRMMVSIFNNEEIEKRAKGDVAPLTDEEVIKVLKRENKKRDESIKVYTEGGRPELAAGEKAEMAVISKYLPAEMPADEVEKVVKAVIAGGASNIGDVMKKVIAETGGRANGKLVSEIAKRELENK